LLFAAALDAKMSSLSVEQQAKIDKDAAKKEAKTEAKEEREEQKRKVRFFVLLPSFTYIDVEGTAGSLQRSPLNG
jgi:hypothetical protein